MKRFLYNFVVAVVACQMFGLLTSTLCASQEGSTDIKDPVKMVLVPAGIYLLGSDEGYLDERPRHEVYIDSFYIDIHEVTNEQYQKFLEATGRQKPDFWHPDLDRPDEPVVGINWHDALAYAKWAGKRLPTEAEWEYAARGGDSQTKYPWGDESDKSYANLNSFGISPVKSFKPNGFGIYDMIGNVWEWCLDWYDKDYYAVSPKENPQGPSTGKYKILRGGAWYCSGSEAKVTTRYYSNLNSISYSFGFRCVKDAK